MAHNSLDSFDLALNQLDEHTQKLAAPVKKETKPEEDIKQPSATSAPSSPKRSPKKKEKVYLVRVNETVYKKLNKIKLKSIIKGGDTLSFSDIINSLISTED